MSMLNIAAVSAAIKSQLRAHPELRELGDDQIEACEYWNTDPARAPWVGVYPGEMTFEPRTLGRGASNRQVTINGKVIVQAHGEDGENAFEELGELLQKVLTAMLSDPTFGGTVEMLKEFRVEFSYLENESETLDFQWAIISFKAEVRTDANS